ncbi:A24 family peptidase [Thalassotalea psychrophila]|uniref:A24 family peptidase n=1 Tax=Thalassotalea psychrophila TaxID=3065647 RepID=UPI003866A628
MDTQHTQLILLGIIALAFFLALYFDLRIQKIPNILCLYVVAIGFTVQFMFFGWAGGLNGLLGLLTAFIILFPAFYFKVLGAGDVKLMMAVGVITGPELIAWSVAYATIAGGVTSLVLVLYKTGWQGVKATLVRYYQCFYVKKYFKPSAGEAAALRVPYAPALAIGWLWACSQNEEILFAISTFRYQFFS